MSSTALVTSSPFSLLVIFARRCSLRARTALHVQLGATPQNCTTMEGLKLAGLGVSDFGLKDEMSSQLSLLL